MPARLILATLIAVLLGFGIAWSCHPAASLQTQRSIKLREVGNRRAFEALTALGDLLVSTTPDSERGLLRWSHRCGATEELPSTTLAQPLLDSNQNNDLISIAIAPGDWADPTTGIYANPFGRGKRWERGGCLSLFESGRLVAETTLGLRIHGETSRKTREKSLRLVLSPLYGASLAASELLPAARGQTLVLHNDQRRLYFVNPIAYEIADLLGCDAPRSRPVRVALNGTELNRVYFLTEHHGRDSLRARLGHDDFASVEVRGACRESKEYRRQFFSVADCSPALMRDAEHDVDIDQLIDWLTTVIFCGTYDARQGVVYRDRRGGRWRWLVWDLDWSFQPWDEAPRDPSHRGDDITANLLRPYCLRTMLFHRLSSDDPAFRRRFLRRVSHALNHEIAEPVLLAITARYRQIGERYGRRSRSRIATALDRIEDFMRQRPALLRAELQRHLGAGPVYRVSVRAPAGSPLTVDGESVDAPYSGHYFCGQTVLIRIADPSCDWTACDWTVNGRPTAAADELELRVRTDLEIEITAR